MCMYVVCNVNLSRPYTLKELSVSVAAQISTCVVHYITVGAFRGGSVLAEVSGWTGMKRSEFEDMFRFSSGSQRDPPLLPLLL